MNKDPKVQENLLKNIDDVTVSQEEELSFQEYQRTVTRSREAKRNRRILILLSTIVYVLGLGLFATIVQTVYEMNHTAGIVTGIVLLVLYTILYILCLVSIYSKHSFDLEFRKRKDGHFSERTNNKVRWEIARNIADQSSVLHYLEKQENKAYLSRSDAEKVDSFRTILSLAEKYPSIAPSSHQKDSIDLVSSLSIAMRKDGVLYKKAKRMILTRSLETGTLTALSPNALMDAGVVAFKDMELIKDLVWLYGFRPTNGEMNRIIFRVIEGVSLSLGLNALPEASTVASKIFRKDSSNFLIQLIGKVADMGAQFFGNGAMTYLIGKYTVRVMLEEYRVQDLFRQKDLKDYQIEMSQKTVEELDEEIEIEVQKHNPSSSEKKVLDNTKPLQIEDEKKHFRVFDLFHHKKKKEKQKKDNLTKE